MKKNRKGNLSSKKRTRKSKSLSIKDFLLFLALIITLLVFIAIYQAIPKVIQLCYEKTRDAGFTINQIIIDGNKHLEEKKILKSLSIEKSMPIFAVSLSDLKSKTEGLDWVKSVKISRILPDKLHISIVETKPIALGQKDRKIYIIDEEGSIINDKIMQDHLDLPIIVGDGVEIYAPSLIKMLKQDHILFKKIQSITRVSERRWNIRFDNGLEVKMPEENMENAWQKIIKMNQKDNLFLPDNAIIDLRIANKIFIEKKQ
jgi:cell division protein FtsQ